MAQTIYDELQGLRPEIVTIGTLLENTDYIDGGRGESDEEDVFQCGKCKKHFYTLGSFVIHKKTHQLGNLTIINQNMVSDASNEPDLQLQPIILNEADILSFNINAAELDLSTPVEIHKEDSMEELLLPVVNSESTPMMTLDQPITFLNEDQIIITENEIVEEDINNEEINKEEQKMVKQDKLKCPYCMKQFTKYFDVQQHIRIHTGERPFQCIICGRGFAQKSNFKKHMEVHKSWPHRIKTLPEKPIQKISTPTEGETVLVDGSYVCQYCRESFSSYTQLKVHRKKHVSHKIFKCVKKYCHEVFVSLDTFLEHTAAHEKDCNAAYHCHKCQQQFQSLEDLNNHQATHLPCRRKKQNTLLCKLCKSKFFSVEALERHQEEDSHTYPCPECEKVFVSEMLLRRHINSHSSVLSFTCSICNKSFKSEHNLSIHQLVHSSERPFKCFVCSATFARQDRLVRHRLMHDSRRFKCPFNKTMGCKMEFYRKDKLKQHILTHSSNKNLRCLRCHRLFKRTAQLRRHEAVCLSEDKPCKDCGHVTTNLDNNKKNKIASKERGLGNRRKYRISKTSKKEDDGVRTIQVVVVPLNKETSDQITNDSGS